MSTTTTDKDQIIKNNLDYTLFSWSQQGGLNPINAKKAKGVYVYDRDGKKYIDFSSQLMNVNIGHGDKRVINAIINQMNELQFVYPGMATDVRGRLGKKLAEITPKKLTKAFFTLGGAEAIENAIKLARIYTGRSKIISFYRSYHGATHGAMSAGGDPRKYAMDKAILFLVFVSLTLTGLWLVIRRTGNYDIDYFTNIARSRNVIRVLLTDIAIPHF